MPALSRFLALLSITTVLPVLATPTTKSPAVAKLLSQQARDVVAKTVTTMAKNNTAHAIHHVLMQHGGGDPDEAHDIAIAIANEAISNTEYLASRMIGRFDLIDPAKLNEAKHNIEAAWRYRAKDSIEELLHNAETAFVGACSIKWPSRKRGLPCVDAGLAAAKRVVNSMARAGPDPLLALRLVGNTYPTFPDALMLALDASYTAGMPDNMDRFKVTWNGIRELHERDLKGARNTHRDWKNYAWNVETGGKPARRNWAISDDEAFSDDRLEQCWWMYPDTFDFDGPIGDKVRFLDTVDAECNEGRMNSVTTTAERIRLIKTITALEAQRVQLYLFQSYGRVFDPNKCLTDVTAAEIQHMSRELAIRRPNMGTAEEIAAPLLTSPFSDGDWTSWRTGDGLAFQAFTGDVIEVKGKVSG